MSENNPVPATAPTGSSRLMSLDALRGFDMFWIIGADSLVAALNRMTQNPATSFLGRQLEHAEWQGFRFYDLIFPLFVFMVGASIVFSLSKIVAESGRVGAIGRVLRRGILLFIIGIIYSGGVSSPWPDIRLMGVLNRIALAYTLAGLLFCCFQPRTLVAICGGLLISYWAMMTFLPIRDIQLEKTNLAALAEQAGDLRLAAQFRDASGASSTNNPSTIKDSAVWIATRKMYASTTNHVRGKFDMGYNVANHFDFEHLPGKKWDLFWDPEGILSTIPAVATCLLGVFAGLLLQRRNVAVPKPVSTIAGFVAGITVVINPVSSIGWLFAWFGAPELAWLWFTVTGLVVGILVTWLLRRNNGVELTKACILFATGILAIHIGGLWGLQFPVIKKIWTSSYVLVAGGYSAILMGVFYLVVDVWKYQLWCQPFVWMGMNSITIYLVKNFLGGTFSRLSARLVGGDIKNYLDAHVAKGFGDLMISIVGLLLAFWLVRFLYKRKIFLRL